MAAVKTILVSQPKPESEKSPYFDLADKMKVKIDFRQFIEVQGVDSQEFRLSKIHLKDFTAVILTSRNAVDHYFRMAKETRFTVPDSMKYFCMSEAVAYYLQKYVVYRKRKIFYGKHNINDLVTVMKKHKNEKFLLPSSDILKPSIPAALNEAAYDYTQAVMYRTVCSDLSDLADITYDMLVFFSPSGIESLFKNFPDFKQNDTRIAAYGNTTIKALEDAGLKVDIKAPHPKYPSMTMAIEHYIKENKK